jgi:quercetin dioxygenase-like cupin family protein
VLFKKTERRRDHQVSAAAPAVRSNAGMNRRSFLNRSGLTIGALAALGDFSQVPDPSQLYILPAPVPGSLSSDRTVGATTVPQSFSHPMMAQQPIKIRSGTVRITDTSVFPASRTISAALVEVEPGGMRELHWHPNTDEWQYYIEGQARMGVFAASCQARTFDFQAGDVGYVPSRWGTTSKIPAPRSSVSLRSSSPAITPTFR